jgi:hypothetical protein
LDIVDDLHHEALNKTWTCLLLLLFIYKKKHEKTGRIVQEKAKKMKTVCVGFVKSEDLRELKSAQFLSKGAVFLFFDGSL